MSPCSFPQASDVVVSLFSSVVYIGEVLFFELEPENRYSRYAIMVKNEDNRIVGHVPAELSKIFNKFLLEYGQIEAECIGK